MSLNASIPPPDAFLTGTLLALLDLAVETGRRARAEHANRKHRPPERGLTLRPGAETPMWNEIRQRLRHHLQARGAKAVLAREIGLPRQRLNQFLHEGSAMPDAERTLMLVAWLLRQESAPPTAYREPEDQDRL